MKYYKADFKYQLAEDEWAYVNICPEIDVITDFIELKETGWLRIKKGYAWDGASGPTWDDRTNLTPSLVHDALAQLIRNKKLPFRLVDRTNKLLGEMCISRGMWRIRAWAWVKALSLTHGRFADARQARKVHYAP